MRARFTAIKPLATAAGLLIVAAGGAELALRIGEPSPAAEVAAPAGRHALVEPSRVVHHSLRPLRTAEVPGPDGTVTLSVNSHGLRGPEVAVPKPPGVYRVLCLGDETVLGPSLPEPYTLPARMQQLLQERTRLRVEVLNAGVPGDCPLLASLRLRHSLLALQPDVVLLHFDMSDVADDQRYRRFTRLDDANVPIACENSALGTPVARPPWWTELRVVGRLIASLDRAEGGAAASGEIDDPRAATAWLRDTPPDWSIYVEQALSPIDDLRRFADGTYSQLVVAVCPQPWQVSAEASDGPGVRDAAGVPAGVVLSSRAPFEAVASYAAARGVPLCDASPAFRDYADPARLYMKNAPHLSRYGQELYARVVSDFLASRLPAFAAERANGDEGLPAIGPGVTDADAASGRATTYR